MAKLFKWQIKIIEDEKLMSNKRLLYKIIQLAAGDDYDGEFTTRGYWEFEYLKKKLFERLETWLKK